MSTGDRVTPNAGDLTTRQPTRSPPHRDTVLLAELDEYLAGRRRGRPEAMLAEVWLGREREAGDGDGGESRRRTSTPIRARG